jgi:pre-mRNA cleavage complex 2 protein Pcf11
MLSFPEANVGSVYQTGRGVVSLDKSQFTNDGVKKKNDTVIASLYNVGLPFVSSSDGRRFGSQFELSSHLDSLFKRRYVAICDDLVTRNRGFLTIMF